jgi:hypothetical protein
MLTQLGKFWVINAADCGAVTFALHDQQHLFSSWYTPIFGVRVPFLTNMYTG